MARLSLASKSNLNSLSSTSTYCLCRSVSSSPYGRTHVWRRRAPSLPAPVVPQFPQQVIRSDGSTFTHWTTSPRSLIRLTRDVTNHPIWNSAAVWARGDAEGDEGEEDGKAKGGLGRFKRRFGGDVMAGVQVDWVEKDGSGTS